MVGDLGRPEPTATLTRCQWNRRLLDNLLDGVDIAGETVNATVTSFRTVEWDSFSPNFFMVFSPGVLNDYPATYISSLYVDETDRSAVLDLMREFPSVTAIDLDAVLGQVRDVMDKAALAVQAVFVFTLLALVISAFVGCGQDDGLVTSATSNYQVAGEEQAGPASATTCSATTAMERSPM